jgi:hypothetical protein
VIRKYPHSEKEIANQQVDINVKLACQWLISIDEVVERKKSIWIVMDYFPINISTLVSFSPVFLFFCFWFDIIDFT